jgi:FHA domain-containing protein
MNHPVLALALQEVETDNTSMWIIIAVVLVILVFIVVIVGVGLTIFFIARKRSKAQKAASGLAVKVSGGPSSAGYAGEAPGQAAIAPPAEPSSAYEGLPSRALDGGIPEASGAAAREETSDFDPSRTVAISREPTVELSFGTIKFVSGVLAGQEFKVDPAGSFIGRESSLSQIVVTDPRISKRHLWIGVRDGVVTIVDQDSRNGTFINDPRSARVTETTLDPGDIVIMGESDVARFEYHK